MFLISSIEAFAFRLKGYLTESVNSFMFSVLLFIAFNCNSLLSAKFFSVFKSPSFLSSSS